MFVNCYSCNNFRNNEGEREKKIRKRPKNVQLLINWPDSDWTADERNGMNPVNRWCVDGIELLVDSKHYSVETKARKFFGDFFAILWATILMAVAYCRCHCCCRRYHHRCCYYYYYSLWFFVVVFKPFVVHFTPPPSPPSPFGNSASNTFDSVNCMFETNLCPF